MGEQVGSSAKSAAGRHASPARRRAALLQTLAARGYEPMERGGEIRLGSCPFDALVDEHRDLVCGMNLALAEGMLQGLGEPGLAARLDPQPGMCCVAIAAPVEAGRRRAAPAGGPKTSPRQRRPQ